MASEDGMRWATGRVLGMLAIAVAAGPVTGFGFSVWAGETSFEEYGAGNYKQALQRLREEFRTPQADSSEFLSRLRMATNIFAQQPSVSVQEILSLYEVASAPATALGYGERVSAEKKVITEFFGPGKSWEVASALTVLNATLKIKKTSDSAVLTRSVKLFALGILARRNTHEKPEEQDWLFVAGKALDADSDSGEFFLEQYLSDSKAKTFKFRKEAFAIIDAYYRREYGKRVPDDVRQKLDGFRAISGS